MSKRKQKILLGVIPLLLSSLLLHVQLGHSKPVALDDRTMDTVMAGSATAGGGVVVGQSSKAAANRTTGLDLSGEAQQGANGFNIVNSTESAVANVVNIWDGSGVIATEEESGTNSEVKINQVNHITQEQVHSATVSGYVRSEADHAETLHRSGSGSYSSKVVDHHSVTNIFDKTHTLITESNGKVNTLLKFDINDEIKFSGHLGAGMVAAGHSEIDFIGGSTDIAVALGNGEITTADNGSLDAAGKLVMVTRVELPSMKIDIDGVGCGVAMGSCNANSFSLEITKIKKDNSTLDIVENHQFGQGSFSEVQTSAYRSPFELKSARAEYIVIDDSTLELNSDVTLELSNSAQKDIKGMNIVNAIGSNVANSTNVARTTRFEARKATLVLNQFNTVNHGH
jgi:hypothetical protein